MIRIGVILGSTRPGRNGEAVAKWVYDIASKRDDAEFEYIDIVDFNLPLLDESVPPSYGQYSKEHTKRWAEKIGSLDAFIFVTPEYNHGTSGALKNAIDFLFAEWNNKAAGFVSYGSAYGVRAVEHLRLVMGIAGATVATLGSARIVPTLLMRDVSGFRLTQMEKVVLVREEVFDGKDCFVVRGFHPYGYQIELWIGKNDFLLRKEREKNDDGTFTEEIRSDIKLNGSIPSEVFQYAPLPKGILIASLTHSPIPDRRNLSLN